MTHRGDFISLWWPGSPRDPEVFWSKPVLSFWLMSIAMHVAGIGLPGGAAGEMALGHARRVGGARAVLPDGRAGHLRGLPGDVALRVAAGGRAGGGRVATAPMYSLVARQAMTDMAFVGPMAMALALGALALFDDADEAAAAAGRGLAELAAPPAVLRHAGAVRCSRPCRS